MKAEATYRRHFLIFIFLSGLCLAQLGWWVTFQVQEGARVSRQQHEVWDEELSIARVHAQAGAFGSPEALEAWLSRSFPDLRLTGDGSDVEVRPEALKRLDKVAGSRTRMFVSEGIFLSLLLLSGIVYIYWTLRRETAFEQRQSVFLAATSHELKTPITSLRLYLDTLVDRDPPPPKRAELVAIMQQDLRRLTELIDRLLQAQALAGNKQPLPLQALELGEETQLVLDGAKGRIETLGLTLNSALEPGLVAMADPERWQVVVSNLLDNAMKYSTRGGKIEVALSRQGRHARLEVTDEGAGIPPAEAERVFQRFYRVGNEDTRRTQGTGLGLYLVREIAKSFGGNARVGRTDTGRGTRLIVEIPLATEP